MRAFVMQGFGTVDQAALGTLPKPECGSDDLLVRVAAAGVNPTDWKEMEGNLVGFYPPYAASWAPGFDAAGTIEAVGSAVVGFEPGEGVVLLADRRGGQCGTFAEYVRVSQKLAAKAPTSISLCDAASIPIAGLTAFQALFRDDMGHVAPGQSILVHGASGGLGSFAVSFAHAHNVHVAVTCREANSSYLRGLGAEVTIDYTSENIVEAVQRWAPSGIDAVIDATSGGKQAELLDTLGPNGRLVIVATVTHDVDIATLQPEAEQRGRAVKYMLLDHSRIAPDLHAVAQLIDAGKMRMPAITRYPLEQAGEALKAMKKGGIRGKLVIEIADLR